MNDNMLNNDEQKIAIAFLPTKSTIHRFSRMVSIVWLFFLLATSIFYCLYYLGDSYNHVSDFIVTLYAM